MLQPQLFTSFLLILAMWWVVNIRGMDPLLFLYYSQLVMRRVVAKIVILVLDKFLCRNNHCLTDTWIPHHISKTMISWDQGWRYHLLALWVKFWSKSNIKSHWKLEGRSTTQKDFVGIICNKIYRCRKGTHDEILIQEDLLVQGWCQEFLFGGVKL